jgi:hypothetical protein
MSKPRSIILCVTIITFLITVIGLPAQDAVPLPVKKVELYKNGIGYFEHLGTVKGQQNVEIALPSSQLNDVLKSLTVIDLGHGQIGGVNYDSAAPLDRRMAEIPIDIASLNSLVEILNRIRGAGIEIRTPSGVVTGKLMSAEMKLGTTGSGGTSQEILLSVYTEKGEIQVVKLESAGALKFTDSELAADLGRYLDLLNSTHQRDIRKLRIKTLGTGERQIYVSYTSETPIWKTTYRIVLDPKQKPLLQGWAIVDNTTPMDWLNVSLSLIAGAPISFIQNLSQPIYAQRPVVPVAQGIQAIPQKHEGTLEEEADAKMSMEVPSPSEDAPGALGSLRRMEKSLGFAAPSTLPDAMMAPPPPPSPSYSDAIRQQVTETAQAHAVAEQFEYKIRQPVTIKRNESALLPIIQSDVEGEKVAIYNGSESHPRLAFWLKNSSGLTLDAGPVTVIDTNSFAGEGLVETIQPGESRLMSYAIDLGTEISTTQGSERQRIERILINQGMLRMFSKTVEKKTYKIRNNNDVVRTIVLEHPVRSNWKLIGMTPAESSSNYYRFKVEAKPKSTTDFVVQEETPLETVFSVASVTPEQIVIWVRDRSIDPETEKALQTITNKKAEINSLNQKITSLDREQNEIFKDQERVRGNMQRLSQTPEEAALRQRYIKQLEAQENRIAALRTEREKLDSARTAAQNQLDALIQNLSLDKKL